MHVNTKGKKEFLVKWILYPVSQALQTKNSFIPPLHSQTERVCGRNTGDLKSVRVAYGTFCSLFQLK